MPYTLNSTLLQLKNDERAKAVLDKHLPGIWQHPQISLALGMPLKVIASLPQAAKAGLTPEKIKAIEVDLGKL